MNTGNEALDRRNEMEMRHDKYLMLGAKWSGWYVTPTLFLKQRYQQSWCKDCHDPRGNQGTRYQHGGDGKYQTNERFG